MDGRGRVFRRLERVDREPLAPRQAVDDRLLVDRRRGGLAPVRIGHRPDAVEEDRADVRDRRGRARQAGQGRRPGALIMGDLAHVAGRAALDLDATFRRIGHEPHRLDFRRAASV
jgi:hypothetical protein